MIVILGDSHTQAIGNSLVRLDPQVRSAIVEKFGEPAVRMIMPGHGISSRFHRIDGQSIYFQRGAGAKAAEVLGSEGAIRADDGNIYGFSFGFHTAVTLRDESWKDYTLLPPIDTKVYISQAVFKDMVLSENRYVLEFARALKQIDLRFFFIAAPPIRQALLDRQAGIASAAELITIQRTYHEIMAEALDALGAPYILPPPSVKEGAVLKAKFDSKIPDDVHHANQSYGMLMWEEFLGRVCI